ncbi:TPA: hypothetical protein RNY16_002196 [Pasteurella multocida]|nr:hypothetical protein [Pasteurella multocida]
MKNFLEKCKKWLNEDVDFGVKSELLHIKKVGLNTWLNEPINSHQFDNLNIKSVIVENHSNSQDKTDLNLNNVMIDNKADYQDKIYYLNLYTSIPFTPSIATPYTPVHEPETPPIDITKGTFTPSCESFITEEETSRISIDTTLINDDLSHK